MSSFDVAVIGGGNAGLSAALTARQAGASVIVLLRRGYAAGLGMTIGTVFGRIAGREAAK